MPHSALKPRDIGLNKLEILVVYSEDKETEKKVRDFIMSEYNEYFLCVNLDEIHGCENIEDCKLKKINYIYINNESLDISIKTYNNVVNIIRNQIHLFF